MEANVIKFELLRKGEKVLCECAILDRIAMFKFNVKGVAQECFEYERRTGKTECRFDNRRDVYTEIYRNKNREELTAFIRQKLLDAGAKEVKA